MVSETPTEIVFETLIQGSKGRIVGFAKALDSFKQVQVQDQVQETSPLAPGGHVPPELGSLGA